MSCGKVTNSILLAIRTTATESTDVSHNDNFYKYKDISRTAFQGPFEILLAVDKKLNPYVT